MEAPDFGGFADGFEFDVSDDERDAPAQAAWDFSGETTTAAARSTRALH